MSTPHIKVHLTLAPGEERSIEASLRHGRYRLRTLEPGDEAEVDWRAGGFPALLVDDAERVHAGAAGAPGELHLANRAARPLTLIVEEREWRRDALSAARVTAMQAFRDLFAEDVLRPGDEVAITRVALMFTDLRGSTAIYEAIGSARAYRLVRDHFAYLAAAVRAHDGTIVKTIGDAVMASFSDPADAVRAALAIQAGIAAYNVGRDRPITIKLGLHCGPCIAVTMNDRLDYFGSTVNLAARLEGESAGGDVVLSRDMLADARVAELLGRCAVREETARLKGFEAPVPFVRVLTNSAGQPPRRSERRTH